LDIVNALIIVVIIVLTRDVLIIIITLLLLFYFCYMLIAQAMICNTCRYQKMLPEDFLANLTYQVCVKWKVTQSL